MGKNIEAQGLLGLVGGLSGSSSGFQRLMSKPKLCEGILSLLLLC